MPKIIRGVSDTIAMLLDSFPAVLFYPGISGYGNNIDIEKPTLIRNTAEPKLLINLNSFLFL
jgi:hypothetical protein